VIIGGGPGGYVAAIKAAQLGFKVRFQLAANLRSQLTPTPLHRPRASRSAVAWEELV
jgi:thioredoxin reductase